MSDSMSIRCLESILDNEMTDMEAKATKIAYLYVGAARKAFPKSSKYQMAKGDPRKSYLFKCCYTFVRQMQHRVKESNYPLYVRAQFDIIKGMTRKSGKLPNVTPNCLCGEKAWKRWMVWKKMYDKKMRGPEEAADKGIDPNNKETVIAALTNDREFLERRLKELTYAVVAQAVSGRSLIRWIASGQVSPYYALLSPILHKWVEDRKLTLGSIFHIDLEFYRPGITPEVKSLFDAQFSHEKGVVGG